MQCLCRLPLHFQMLSIILTAPKKWTSYFNTSSNRIFVSALMKCGLDTFIFCTLSSLEKCIPSNVNAFFVSVSKGVYKEIRGTLYANEILGTEFHLVKHLNMPPAENQVLNCAPMSLKTLIRPLILSCGKCAPVKKHLVKTNTKGNKLKCLDKQH